MTRHHSLAVAIASLIALGQADAAVLDHSAAATSDSAALSAKPQRVAPSNTDAVEFHIHSSAALFTAAGLEVATEGSDLPSSALSSLSDVALTLARSDDPASADDDLFLIASSNAITADDLVMLAQNDLADTAAGDALASDTAPSFNDLFGAGAEDGGATVSALSASFEAQAVGSSYSPGAALAISLAPEPVTLGMIAALPILFLRRRHLNA